MALTSTTPRANGTTAVADDARWANFAFGRIYQECALVDIVRYDSKKARVSSVLCDAASYELWLNAVHGVVHSAQLNAFSSAG